MEFTLDLHTHTVASGHAYSTVQEMAILSWSLCLSWAMWADSLIGPGMVSAPVWNGVPALSVGALMNAAIWKQE